VRLAWLGTYVAHYVAHDDPLVRAANVIALVVAGNQPFYPLYVHWIVGHDIAPTLATFLSTPFFAAVPAISRRDTRWGRAVLVLAGMANTVMVTKILGPASGVGLFLIPCLLLAAAFFRPAERAISLGLLAVGGAIFFGLDGRYGAPIRQAMAADDAALTTLHLASVGVLVVFIGLMLGGLTGSGSPDNRTSPPRR
jgi:hypothetical protein